MADELNVPTHRWYQPRNHIKLAARDVSAKYIYDSGIQKIDAFIAQQPWGLSAMAKWFLATGTFDTAGTHRDEIPLDQTWFLSTGTFNPTGVHDDTRAL